MTPTPTTIGRYEIKSEIGRGGMATVFLAYDPRFRRNIAIKLVSVNLQENNIFRERFEREAQLIARIEHPAIVPVYDFGEQDNQPYLVMRHMPGGSLTSKIKEGPFPLRKTAQFLSQIAPALDAVHAQGIIHRDLKPANILLDAFGNPAISDFGIAHFTQATTDLTGSAVIGTPAYMSPEQVRSDPDLDGRSDIYALGVILFEMLTGSGPFRAQTPLSAAMKHLTEPVPSIKNIRIDLPDEVDDILQKAMAKDRETRYASAAELSQALNEAVGNSTGEEKPVIRPNQSSRRQDMVTEIDSGKENEASIFEPASIPSVKTSSVRQTSSLATKPKWSMMRGVAGLAGVGLCLVILCGSMSLFGIWSRLGLGESETPTPSPSPSIPQESILYFDDFSNPSSGFPTLQTVRGSYSYRSGSYHIVVDEVGGVLWAKTTVQYSDTSVSVDASLVSRETNGYFGLLCRIRDDDNFYYFVIRNTGEYTLGKYKNAQFQSLLSEGWKQSSAINMNIQPHRIKADCDRNILRLYVNDTLLDEVTDSDFPSGYNGILAASLDSQGFEVLFDNFLIIEPVQ